MVAVNAKFALSTNTFSVGFGEITLKPVTNQPSRIAMLIKGKHRTVLELSADDALATKQAA